MPTNVLPVLHTVSVSTLQRMLCAGDKLGHRSADPFGGRPGMFAVDVYAAAPVRALLTSLGVAHTIAAAGRNQAERKARSLAKS